MTETRDHSLTAMLKGFFSDERGATAIEYGLLGAMIGIGIIIAARGLGAELSALYNWISEEYLGAQPDIG